MDAFSGPSHPLITPISPQHHAVPNCTIFSVHDICQPCQATTSAAPTYVGYAQSGLKFGGTIATPQFLNVGNGSNTALESIVPVGTDLSDNINLQTLDAYGRTVGSYLWIDYAGVEGDQEAWVDPDTYETVEGVSFAPGSGVWITGTDATQAIQTAGRVGKNDIDVSLKFGGTVTGNPFPTSVSLQDILPTGSDLSDNINIQTLDAYGRTVDSYLWINYAGDNGDQEAWVNPDTYEIVTDVEFVGGSGLWITGTAEDQSVRFPAPEL